MITLYKLVASTNGHRERRPDGAVNKYGRLTIRVVRVNIFARVFRVGSSLPTKDGNTAHKFKVADKTGSVDLTVWNEVGEAINCGDIIRLIKG